MTRIEIGFNDLATTNPELINEWHPTKNGNLKPTELTAGSRKKVWWYLPYDDPITGKHFDFEWEMAVINRTKQNQKCPFLSGRALWRGFNDLQTRFPEVSKQWHPTKNGTLQPSDVTAKSAKKVWWLLSYDDPTTGKHFDFEWEAKVYCRTNGHTCPYLVGKEVWNGFNDLETTHPKLAKQWHPTKNGKLKPINFSAGSNKKVWWYLPYDDSKTGKHFDFEWEDTIVHRSEGRNCPYISGKALFIGYNDLATTHPELAKEWHPTKNHGLTPSDVSAGMNKKVWWLLPYDDPISGKHFDFEWEANINNRANKSADCPFLNNTAVWPGFNDLLTRRPSLAAQWHPRKNGKLLPSHVLEYSMNNVWWYLPYDDPKTGKHFDFEWQARIAYRTADNTGCPYISGKAVFEGFNDLSTTHPELAKEWHFEKNQSLKPTNVTAGSNKKVWWQLPYTDPKTGEQYTFEWKASIIDRTYNNAGCPYIEQSNGEQLVRKYLDNHKIKYFYQKTFDSLYGTHNGLLSYDFAIPTDENTFILIEYQGLQHFQACDFFGGEIQFKRQVEHDRRKRSFAKKLGFKLIEIKYTYTTYESISNLLDENLMF